MKRFLISLCSLCVLCGYSFGLDRNAFVFSRYDLELRVDPAGHAMAARGKITLLNASEAPQRNASLQISSTFQWRMIRLEGKDLQFVADAYTSDIDHTGMVNEAIVQLPAPVAPGGTVELEVGYSGTVPRDATRLTRIGVPAAQATHTEWDSIAEPVTAVRGVGFVTWYPVSMEAASLSQGSLFPLLAAWKDSERAAAMKVNLCWVSDATSQTVVTNGRFLGVSRSAPTDVEEQPEHIGCSQYEFTRLNETVPTFAIAAYEDLSRPQMDVYHLADHAAGAQEYALDAEKDATALADWFGAPRQKVTIVQLPDDQDSPWESGAILFTPVLAGDRKTIEVHLAHQVTHAAFYSPRQWINEGLAYFAQALVREQQDGRAAAVSSLDNLLPALVEAEGQPARAASSSSSNAGSALRSLINTDDEILFRVKAAFVFWMLREMVGDAALKQAIRDYRPAEDTTTAYLPNLIQRQTKRDLAWFFDDWVYRDRGLPDFHVVTAYPRPTLAGAFVVTVTVENLGDCGAEVPVRALVSEGEEKSTRVVVRAHEKVVTRVEIPGTPTEVIVNDGSVPESDIKNNSFALKMTKQQ